MILPVSKNVINQTSKQEMRQQPMMKPHYTAHNNVYRLVTIICVVLFFGITSVFLVLQSLQGSWADWKQATCMPDTCFCEKPNGTLLQQPTNTYTNLTFCLVGCIIYVMVSKSLDQPSSQEDSESVFWLYATLYATGCVLLGLGSGLYHASMTFAFQVVDNVGMYFIICWAFTYNLVRISPKRFQQTVFYALYFSLIILFTLINIYMPVVRRYAFFAMVIIYIVSEYFVDVRKKQELDENDYQMNWTVWYIALGSIAVGFFLWNMDQNKVWCDPNSAFQLHGVWHSLCALSSFCLFYFYWGEKKKPANMQLVKRRQQANPLDDEQQELMKMNGEVDEEEYNATAREELIYEDPTQIPQQQPTTTTMMTPMMPVAVPVFPQQPARFLQHAYLPQNGFVAQPIYTVQQQQQALVPQFVPTPSNQQQQISASHQDQRLYPISIHQL